MRVVFWSDLFWPYLGGIERLGARLVPALAAHGHQLSVVTSHHTLELPDVVTWEGVEVRRLPFRQALRRPEAGLLPRVHLDVERALQAARPDLVHLYGLGPSALFYARAAAGRAAPLLLSLHQELLPSHGDGAHTLLSELLDRATWVHAVSRPVLEQARALVPAVRRRSSVIWNFAEPATIPAAPVAAGPPVILCLGRLIPQKGFDLAVEAFAAIRPRVPAVRLLMAGEGADRPALERRVGELGLAARVEFTGWVAPPDVPALLDRSTLVLMPSRREGLGLVAVEAALRGRPVVAARVGGLVDVIRDGRTGLLVEPGSVPALAAAVLRLLADPGTARRMGQAAQRRARALFGPERGLARYAALYAKLARMGKRP